MSAIPVLTNEILLSLLRYSPQMVELYNDDRDSLPSIDKSILFTRLIADINKLRLNIYDSITVDIIAFTNSDGDILFGHIFKGINVPDNITKNQVKNNNEYYIIFTKMPTENPLPGRTYFNHPREGGTSYYEFIVIYQFPSSGGAGAGSGSAASAPGGAAAAPSAGAGSGSAASAPGGASAALPGAAASSSRELELLKDRITCSICLEREKNTRLNCGHMICDTCASSISLCPICRAPITSRDRVYLGGYKQKYLKYKQKYLALKKQIF